MQIFLWRPPWEVKQDVWKSNRNLQCTTLRSWRTKLTQGGIEVINTLKKELKRKSPKSACKPLHIFKWSWFVLKCGMFQRNQCQRIITKKLKELSKIHSFNNQASTTSSIQSEFAVLVKKWENITNIQENISELKKKKQPMSETLEFTNRESYVKEAEKFNGKYSE